MGHPDIDNQTPYAFVPSFAMDEEGRPLLVALLQATYTIVPRLPLELAEEQEPPNLVGELWGDDAESSSYKIEPAFAFTKLATDVVLVGHAQKPGVAVKQLMVGMAVGSRTKVLRVTGDRVWVSSTGVSDPVAFEKMPLQYERAFGGRDPAFDTYEHRNPVGMGYRDPRNVFTKGVRVPNIEDPGHPVQRMGQGVPAGVGFLSPNWKPRAAYAGTYDEAWSKNRMPLLPRDFDRRFFSAASPGLVIEGYVQGGEAIVVEGASQHGSIGFNLPGHPPPRCRAQLARRSDAEMALKLDTLVIDTDQDRVLLLYRGFTELDDGPHDVRAIELTIPAPEDKSTTGAPRAWFC